MELHRPSGNIWLGLGFAATTMLLWGVLPLALDLALESLDAISITCFRFAVAAAALAVWLGARRRLPALGRLGRSGWLLLAGATLGLTINYVSYLTGLERTTPANAALLIQSAPLLLALGGVLVFREHFTLLQWMGFATLVTGLGVFFESQVRALAAGIDRYLGGVALLAVAAVTWAGYGLAQKQLLRALPSQAAMLCIYVGCALCLLPGSAPAAVLGLSARELAILLFCAINTLVAYGTFAAALEHWEASRVSAVLSLTPLATLAFSALATALAPGAFAPEHLSAEAIAGAGLVVAGSLATSLGGRPAS